MRRGAPAASGHPAPKKIPFYRRKDDPSPASGSAALASDGAVTGTGTGAAMISGFYPTAILATMLLANEFRTASTLALQLMFVIPAVADTFAFAVGSVAQYVGAITALSGSVGTLVSTWGEFRANAVFLRQIGEIARGDEARQRIELVGAAREEPAVSRRIE